MLTPLHALAFSSGKHEKLNIDIQYLVKNGANVKARSIDGLTPLRAAVSGFMEASKIESSIDCIKSLIQFGADVNEKCLRMNTPLAWALFKRNNVDLCDKTRPITILKELCKLKASIDTVSVGNSNAFHVIVAGGQKDGSDTSIQLIKFLITHARCDSYDKSSKTVLCALLAFQRLEETKEIKKLPKDIKLHILAQLPLSDLYPYKKLCEKLLQGNYKHIFLPQIYERMKHVTHVLASLDIDNQTALEYALEKHAENQEYINKVRRFLDGSRLQADYDDFIAHFPEIANSDLEKDKDNLVRQMFDNCMQLFLE